MCEMALETGRGLQPRPHHLVLGSSVAVQDQGTAASGAGLFGLRWSNYKDCP